MERDRPGQERQAGWACPWLEGRPEAVTFQVVQGGRRGQTPTSIRFDQIWKAACRPSAYGTVSTAGARLINFVLTSILQRTRVARLRL